MTGRMVDFLYPINGDGCVILQRRYDPEEPLDYIERCSSKY